MITNTPVTAEEVPDLIDAAGGYRELAQALGIGEKKSLRQQVHQWKRRGISWKLVGPHYAEIQRLRAVVASFPKRRKAKSPKKAGIA